MNTIKTITDLNQKLTPDQIEELLNKCYGANFVSDYIDTHYSGDNEEAVKSLLDAIINEYSELYTLNSLTGEIENIYKLNGKWSPVSIYLV